MSHQCHTCERGNRDMIIDTHQVPMLSRHKVEGLRIISSGCCSGWLALSDHNKLALKPTVFADNRLIFLEPIEGICEAFSGVQSGNYDVKVCST